MLRRAPALLALLLLATAARAGDPPAAPAWSEPEVLAAALAEACDAVEEICGAKFTKRPEARISTSEEVARVVEKEIGPLWGRLGTGGDPEGAARAVSHAIVGKCELETGTVHVVRAVIEASGEGFGRDELRVLLAHECTHALDVQRFAAAKRVEEVATVDALKALSAVLEGHAQWAAERAAARWKIPETFVRLTERMVRKPEHPTDASPELGALMDALHAELTFAYVHGLAFFHAIDSAGGRDAVERALREPPTTTRAIERPEEWFRGAPHADEPDLEALVELARPWVSDPAWKVVTSRVSEALLRSQAKVTPEDQRAGYLDGYVDGRALGAEVPGDPAEVMVHVASFRTPEDAQRFARQVAAGTEEIAGVKTGSGVGPDGRFPGKWSHFEEAQEDGRFVLDAVVGVLGRVAVNMFVSGDGSIDRAAIDELLLRMDAQIADPTKAAAPIAARPYKRKSRMVTIRVVDTDSAPVPRATAHAFHEREESETPVKNGKAELTVVRKPSTVGVWGAAAADGTPLRLAPRWGVPLAPDATEVEVRLAPGTSISGKVVGEDGKPVAGAEVEAQGTDVDTFGDAAGSVRVTARTGADGAFEIVGVTADTYALRVRVGERSALHEDVDAKGGDTGVVVTIRPTTARRLRILDADGKALPGAFVSVHRLGSGAGGTFFGRVEGEDGSITLEGLDPSSEALLSIDPPRDRDDVGRIDNRRLDAEEEVRMPRGWTLRGVVLDEAGKHVPEAWVRWKTESGWRTVRAEADGRFTIRNVPEGPAHVTTGEGERPGPFSRDDPEWTEAKQDGGEVTLRLSKPAEERSVTVRVLAPDGTVVPSVRLWIETHEGSSSRGTTTTGPTFRPPQRPYDLEVYRARDAQGRTLDLGPARREGIDPSLREVEVTLPPGRSIAGRVRTNAGSGEGVARVKITASTAAGGGRMAVAHGETESGADGAFVLRGLGEGPYTLAVEPPRPFARPDDVEAESGADDVAIWVATAQRSTVTVVDWAGKPVRSVVLSLEVVTRHGASSWSTRSGPTVTTDADGKATFEDLTPGAELHLEVSPPQSRNDLRKPDKWRWKPEQDRIVLERGFTVRGEVAGEGARAGVRVVGRWDGDEHEVAVTGADGRFEARGLPYGSVTLSAKRSRDFEEDEEGPRVEVTPEAPTAKLELPKKRETARVRVAGYVDGRQGFVAAEGGRGPDEVVPIRFGADGVAEIPKIKPGTYSVWIPPGTGDPTCVWKTGVALGAGEVALEPGPCAALRFRLKMPAGSTVHRTDVLGPLGIPIQAQPDAAGEVYEAHVPAGTWIVKAKVRAADWLYATVDVSTDAVAEVELKPYGAK